MKKLLTIFCVAMACMLLGFVSCVSHIMPIQKGRLINTQYDTYWKNYGGIYYYSLGMKSQLNLFNHGMFGYLHPAPEQASFVVLNRQFAKDDKHVWHGEELLTGVDAATFYIDPSGLAKDRNTVYVYHEGGGFGPFENSIDVATAEYFVFLKNGQDWGWVRDKDHVFLEEQIQDVDRETFGWDEANSCFADKDHQYEVWWSSTENRCILHTRQ